MPTKPAKRLTHGAFAAHVQQFSDEQSKTLAEAEDAYKRATEAEVRAKARAEAAYKRAAEAKARAKARAEAAEAEARAKAKAEAEAAEAEARAKAAAKAEIAKRLQIHQDAAGRLAVSLCDTLPLLQQFPDLAKPYLEEFRGMVKVDGRAPPSGATLQAARQAILDQIADRFDELEDSPLCSIDESDREELDQWQPTRAEFEFVKLYFFRELFAARPKPKEAAPSAPGSPDRIEEMTRRHEAGEDLYHPEDAKVDGRKLQTRKRLNGGSKEDGDDGLQILGWA